MIRQSRDTSIGLGENCKTLSFSHPARACVFGYIYIYEFIPYLIKTTLQIYYFVDILQWHYNNFFFFNFSLLCPKRFIYTHICEMVTIT